MLSIAVLLTTTDSLRVFKAMVHKAKVWARVAKAVKAKKAAREAKREVLPKMLRVTPR